MPARSLIPGVIMLLCATAAGAQTRPGVPTSDLRSAAPSVLTVGAACQRSFGAESSELPEGLSVVAGAVLLSSGGVAVVDSRNRSLLVFDSTGQLTRRSGGAGLGPGEFPGVNARLIPYRGDSLLVMHTAIRQILFQVFSGEGRYARSFQAELDWGQVTRPWVVGASASGNIIVSSMASVRPSQGRTIGLDSVRFIALDAEGRRLTQSGFVQDAVWAIQRTQTSTPTAGGGVSSRVSLRLVSAGDVSRAGSGIAAGIATTAVRGTQLFHFEEPGDVLVVYDGGWSQSRRMLFPPLAERSRPAEARIRPQEESQMLEVLADAAGRAWVEMPRDSTGSGRRWWIVDASGGLRGEVRTPAGERVLDAGLNHVLLLRRDQDDVETVVLCNLPR